MDAVGRCQYVYVAARVHIHPAAVEDTTVGPGSGTVMVVPLESNLPEMPENNMLQVFFDLAET